MKQIINVKTKNDVSINSLLVDETMSTNTKLIANHFNIFFLQVLLPQTKRKHCESVFTLSWPDY